MVDNGKESYTDREEIFNIEVGSLLIKYKVDWKTKGQYLSGIEAQASKERPISTTCPCFLSTWPFCWKVDGQDTLCRILNLHKVSIKAWNSPP